MRLKLIVEFNQGDYYVSANDQYGPVCHARHRLRDKAIVKAEEKAEDALGEDCEFEVVDIGANTDGE